jgi:hypothetical protein
MLNTGQVLGLSEENDGDNDTINGHGLAEDDTDQILGLDTRHLDRTTQQGATCDEYTPKTPRLASIMQEMRGLTMRHQ